MPHPSIFSGLLDGQAWDQGARRDVVLSARGEKPRKGYHRLEEVDDGPARAKEAALSSDEIVQWLLTADESDVSHVLGRVAVERPGLEWPNIGRKSKHIEFVNKFRNSHEFSEEELRAMEEAARRHSLSSNGSSDLCEPEPAKPSLIACLPKSLKRGLTLMNLAGSDDSELDQARSELLDNKDNTRPILQFSSSMYYCVEGEDFANLDVMRIGSLKNRVQVGYETRDSSAKAGLAYESKTGVLVFEPGESEKTIYVPIIQNDRWDTTVEFEVRLLSDDRLQQAMLGKYLWRTRVKIIDDDCFPSNKYREEIMHGIQVDGNLSNVPHIGLLMEYIMLNFQNPDIQWGSIKMLMSDQLHNFFILLKLFVNVYLIDYVLKAPEEGAEEWLIGGSREVSLLVMSVSVLFPFSLLHYLDYAKPTWKVAGTAIRTLQVALLRKFLNYNDASRAVVDTGQLITAVTRDAIDVVQGGYIRAFELVKAVGSFAVMLSFHCIAPWIFNKPFNLLAFGPVLIYPFLLGGTLALRYAITKAYLKEKYERQVFVVAHTNETVINYRLIADYHRRPVAAEMFEDLIKRFGKANIDLLQCIVNNSYIVPWFSLMIMVAYAVVGGMRVLEGALSIGMFITNIHIFGEVGGACAKVYEVILGIQTALPELERITQFLNLEIDVHDRMKLTRHRRRQTKIFYKALTEANRVDEDNPKETPLIDRIPIIMQNVMTESINSVHGSLVKDIRPFTVKFDQGKLISLIGPHGQGKSTFLRALGGATLPKLHAGSIFFIPAHLRVLHVPAEPMFFTGTLYANLTFGCNPGDSDAKRSRVKNILKKLTVPDHLIDEISDSNGDDEAETWMYVMSQTQKHLLTIARALIATPEMLVIHKPTELLNGEASERTLGLLREFVNKRGIEQDESKTMIRRPRTCLFTTSTANRHEVEVADEIFRVTREYGIVSIAKSRVTQEMLEV